MVTFAPTEAIWLKVVPLADRSMRKPVSRPELSVQRRFTLRLPCGELAVRPVGAGGIGTVVVVVAATVVVVVVGGGVVVVVVGGSAVVVVVVGGGRGRGRRRVVDADDLGHRGHARRR